MRTAGRKLQHTKAHVEGFHWIWQTTECCMVASAIDNVVVVPNWTACEAIEANKMITAGQP